jgi:hypothetical protein
MRLRVVSGPLSVVACVIAATACGGHVTGPESVRPAGAPPAASPSARAVALRAPWPERRIAAESAGTGSQVFDPGTGMLYALVSGTPASGRYVLQATDLRTGAVRRGPSYSLAQLSLVAGYLWVSGRPSAGMPPVLAQVDPGTLRTVRATWPTPITARRRG